MINLLKMENELSAHFNDAKEWQMLKAARNSVCICIQDTLHSSTLKFVPTLIQTDLFVEFFVHCIPNSSCKYIQVCYLYRSMDSTTCNAGMK